MQTDRSHGSVPLELVQSEAEFVLISETRELLSEHCTLKEAMRAYYQKAANQELGEHLPIVYRRGEQGWLRCAHY